MRSYHIAAASLAIGCEIKWLDNVVTQCSPSGVTRAQRGVARRLSIDSVVTIAVARQLAFDLGAPMARSLELAAALIDNGGQLVCPGGSGIAFDVAAMRRQVERRLEDAAEVLVAPRRGRPPKVRNGDARA